MSIDPAGQDAYAWPRPKHSPTLADLHAHYLAERGLTLKTEDIPNGPTRWRKQMLYVLGEALELSDAVIDAAVQHAAGEPVDTTHIRHEISDVAITLITLAKFLDVTVEGCIAEKTAADRGRG